MHEGWRVAAVTDPRADRRALARVSCQVVVDALEQLLQTSGLTDVIVTEPVRTRTPLVERCLQARKNVWLEPPLSGDLRQVRRLQTLARDCRVSLQLLQTQRFERQYRLALQALQSQRLGQLRSIRYVAAEWTSFVGDQGAAACPLVDPVEQFGPHGFDQLLGFVDADPHWVWARRCSGEDGFLAVIGFANGVTAQIEIRRRARATCHTGWVLEGEDASYQQGRLISVSGEGELLDEAVVCPPLADDPFLICLAQSSPSSEREQHRAWLAVGLMLAVQRACLKNTTVRWDEVVGG